MASRTGASPVTLAIIVRGAHGQRRVRRRLPRRAPSARAFAHGHMTGPVRKGRVSSIFRYDFTGTASMRLSAATLECRDRAQQSQQTNARVIPISRDSSLISTANGTPLASSALRQSAPSPRPSCPPSSTYTSARLDTRGSRHPSTLGSRLARLRPARLGTRSDALHHRRRWAKHLENRHPRGYGINADTVVSGILPVRINFGGGRALRNRSSCGAPPVRSPDDGHVSPSNGTTEGMRWLYDEAFTTRTQRRYGRAHRRTTHGSSISLLHLLQTNLAVF